MTERADRRYSDDEVALSWGARVGWPFWRHAPVWTRATARFEARFERLVDSLRTTIRAETGTPGS